MRRSASALVAAVAIVSNAAPAALAEAGGAVQLVPVPWNSAPAIWNPEPPYDQFPTCMYHGVEFLTHVEYRCVRRNGGGCVGDSSRGESWSSPRDQVDAYQNQLGFRSSFSSTFDGNKWTATPTVELIEPDVQPGSPVTDATPWEWSLKVTLSSFRAFTVPRGTAGDILSPIIVRHNDVATATASYGSVMGSNCTSDDPLIHEMIAGDTVMVGVAETVIDLTAKNNAYWSPSGVYVSKIDRTYGTTCSNSFPHPSGCTIETELFSPVASSQEASLACQSDLTGDGVVNFADLAKMKSVFFKTCTP